MQTRTDLANAALSYLGEMQISSIDDTSSKPARTCKQFMQDTIDEVLRGHRWSCATDLATLTESGDTPLWGFEKQFVLPNNRLQVLEVNGQAFGPVQQFFAIQGNFLLTNWEEAHIRYVKRIDVPDFDPLLAKAIALQLASKICIPLSLNAANQQSCVVQYNQAVSEAKRINAIESTTNANHQWGKVFGSSPLLGVRGWGGNSLLRYGYRFTPIGGQFGPY
jgi:hypothetical protein